MIICLTGLPGSGKTEAATILVRRGFAVFEMSSVLKEMMKERGIEVSSSSLEHFAKEIKEEKGEDIVAVELLKNIRKSEKIDIVISGARNRDEIEYIRKNLESVYVIAIIAPQETRFGRLVRQRREGGIRTYEEFLYREQNNKKNLHIDGAIGMADYTIENTGTKRQFEEKIDKAVAELEERPSS